MIWLFPGTCALAWLLLSVFPQFDSPLPWLFLVATVGMYHGGFDMVVFSTLYPQWGKRLFAMCLYTLLAVAIAGLYLLSPSLFLILLLVEGLIHFGEEDSLLALDGHARVAAWCERLCRGTFPLIFAALGFPDQVRWIFEAISSNSELSSGLVASAPWGAVLLLLAPVIAWSARAEQGLFVAVELLTLAACFAGLPPAAAFACYFVMLHSRRHLAELAEQLPGSWSFWRRWANPSSWLATLLVLLPFFILFKDSDLWTAASIYPYLAFACLTPPHVALHFVFKKSALNL